MSIPLVQEATKDAINTSIIAIKRNIERINMLLGLVDNDSPDLSGFATKQELEDAITQVETDLAPVDEVTSGNMQPVTSNAVYNAITGIITPVKYIKFKSSVSFSGKQYIFNGMFFIQGDITTRQAIAQYESIANITINSLKTPFGFIGVPYYPNAISGCYILNNSGWSLIVRSALNSGLTFNINYCCSLP